MRDFRFFNYEDVNYKKVGYPNCETAREALGA